MYPTIASIMTPKYRKAAEIVEPTDPTPTDPWYIIAADNHESRVLSDSGELENKQALIDYLKA